MEFEESRHLVNSHWLVWNLLTWHLWTLEESRDRVERRKRETQIQFNNNHLVLCNISTAITIDSLHLPLDLASTSSREISVELNFSHYLISHPLPNGIVVEAKEKGIAFQCSSPNQKCERKVKNQMKPLTSVASTCKGESSWQDTSSYNYLIVEEEGEESIPGNVGVREKGYNC